MVGFAIFSKSQFATLNETKGMGMKYTKIERQLLLYEILFTSKIIKKYILTVLDMTKNCLFLWSNIRSREYCYITKTKQMIENDL